MQREPWSDIGRLQNNVRSLESNLNRKVDAHEIHTTNRNVDSLERTVRELSSTVDGLSSELQTLQAEMRDLQAFLNHP